ncbi:MAG: HAD-IIIA family hydrolase [Bacteroidota bacterium]
MNKALFLDRDGILNKVVMRNGQVGSPRSVSEFEIIIEAKDLVNRSKAREYLVLVVTNQPDVGRGVMNFAEVEAMHRILRGTFSIDDITVCTTGDDSDFRRKPNPGMILELAERFKVDLTNSFLLGDNQKDIAAGKTAGVKTILLKKPYNKDIQGIADYDCSTYAEVMNVL